MASNRHLGRIVALQTLYEYEFRIQSGDESAVLEEILERNIGRYQETIDDKDFIRGLVTGTANSIEELDAIIQPIAPEWPVEQIARVDRAILRMALHELYHGQDVPPKVVINEAVELAKAFGGENSSRFVNGVLGTAFRLKEEKQKPAKAKTKTKTKPAKAKTSSAKPKSSSSKAKPKKSPKTKAAKKSPDK